MRRFKPSSGNVFDQERTCSVCSVKYNDDRAFETHLAGWAHRRRLASQQGGASVTSGSYSDPVATVRLSREVKLTEQQAQTTHLPPLYPLLPGQAANTLDSAATAIIVPAAVSVVNLVPPTNLVPHVTIPSVTIPSAVTTAAFDPPGPAATKSRKSKKNQKKLTSNQNVRCDDCQKEFLNVGSLEQHYKSKHQEKLAFNQNVRCDDCQREFLNVGLLEQHCKSKKHQEKLASNQNVRCDDCQREFLNVRALEQHCKGKQHQKNLASNSAKISKTTFKKRRTKAVFFHCELCSRIAVNNSALKKLLLETPRSFTARWVFDSESALQYHLLKDHTNETVAAWEAAWEAWEAWKGAFRRVLLEGNFIRETRFPWQRSLVYCHTCPAIFDTKNALKQHCDNSLKHQLLVEFYHWKKSTVTGGSISFSTAPLVSQKKCRFAIPRHDGIEVRFCNTCQLHSRFPQPVKHYLNRSRHQTLARQQADKHAAFAVQEFQRTKARCVPRIIAIFSRNQHMHHKIFDSPHHQDNISDSPHQPLKYSNTIDFGNIDPRERMCPYDIINIINPSKKSPIALTAIHRESITSPFDISVQLPIEIPPLESTRVEIAFDKHGHPNGHYLEHLTFKFTNLYDGDVPEDVILTLVATLGEPEPIPKPAVVKKNDLNNDTPPDCDTLVMGDCWPLQKFMPIKKVREWVGYVRQDDRWIGPTKIAVQYEDMAVASVSKVSKPVSQGSEPDKWILEREE